MVILKEQQIEGIRFFSSLSLSLNLSPIFPTYSLWPRRGRPFLFRLLDNGGRFGIIFHFCLVRKIQ